MKDVSKSVIIIWKSVKYSVAMGAHTDKVGARDVVLIASIFDLSRSEVEWKDCNCIRVLIGHNQELTRVIKLKVTRSFSTRMKEAHLSQCPSHGLAFCATALLRAEDAQGFVPTVGDNDKSPRLVNTYPSTGVHSGRECGWDSLDALDELEGGTAFELVHG